ncbi:MAG: hypothetical protein WCK29_03855 [archaeon]
MIIFELGNRETIEKLVKKNFVYGKFVFRRDDSLFKIYMGEYNSHPDLVRDLKLIKPNESQYQVIWGGGEVGIAMKKMDFTGNSGNYGQVPNSFLIDCIRNVRIQGIEQFTFKLSPYSREDENLEARRKTWRDIGNYELDTERKLYLFDGNMNPIR